MKRYFFLILIILAVIVLFSGPGDIVMGDGPENGWVQIADFEDDEIWSEASGTWVADTIHYIEGSQGWRAQIGNGIALSCSYVDLDLGAFTDDDFVHLAFYTPDAPGPTKITSVRVRFQTSTGNSYDFSKDYDDLSVGWNHLRWRRGDAGKVGSPDWGDITLICTYIYCLYGEGEAAFDDWRIMKAYRQYLPIILNN